MPVSADQLHQIAPGADPAICKMIEDRADDVLPRFGLVKPLIFCHFITQVCVESAFFTKLEEDLSYSAERLHEVWPHRFPTVASGRPCAHNPQALARKVYGGRMGNVGPDDGWIYRGRGLIQTTGMDNFKRLANVMRTTIEDALERVTDPQHALECAAATFTMLGCLAPAAADDLHGVIARVRGGVTDEDMRVRGGVLRKARAIFNH